MPIATKKTTATQHSNVAGAIAVLEGGGVVVLSQV